MCFSYTSSFCSSYQTLIYIYIYIHICTAALEYGYNTKEPSRTTTHGQVQHSTTRNPPRPPSKEIPNKAPFLIFVGSLSFETNAQDIDLLFKDQDVFHFSMIFLF